MHFIRTYLVFPFGPDPLAGTVDGQTDFDVTGAFAVHLITVVQWALRTHFTKAAGERDFPYYTLLRFPIVLGSFMCAGRSTTLV